LSNTSSAGTTARSAALLTGVNQHTATLFFRKLREVIAQRLNEEAPELLGGEVEIDESYFGGRRKVNGDAALAARFPSSACSSGAARSIR
jgi:transposase